MHPICDISTQFRDGCAFSLVAGDECLYMLGGLMGGQALNTAAVYEIKSNKWRSLPNMPFASYLCSSVLINNVLYVTGSRNIDSSGNVHVVNEVSALPLNTSNWMRLKPLKYVSATVTALHEKLIATGGESLDGHDVSRVEVFNNISDQWMSLPNMTVPRRYHGVCVTEDSLAVVGGVRTTDCEMLKFL